MGKRYKNWITLWDEMDFRWMLGDNQLSAYIGYQVSVNEVIGRKNKVHCCMSQKFFKMDF